MDVKPRLGRGLTSLLGDGGTDGPGAARANLPVEQIQTNPYQPRKIFDDDEIHHLSDSIKNHGIIGDAVERGRIAVTQRGAMQPHAFGKNWDRIARFSVLHERGAILVETGKGPSILQP